MSIKTKITMLVVGSVVTLSAALVVISTVVSGALAEWGTIAKVLVFLVIGIILFFIARTVGDAIASPIVICMERIKLLSEGDLKSTMPVIKNKDEIGDLVLSTEALVNNFNVMISDFTSTLSRLAEGDLTVGKSSVVYKGDFIPLQMASEKIAVALNKIVSTISMSADEIANGSDQVADGGVMLAQGTAEQARQVESLVRAVDKVATLTANDGINAQGASEFAESANESIRRGNMEMGDLLTSMGEITEKSNAISKIIKTIDDIAFQTNILALNAAVEAARAGSAGKGFAVVADEVRNLANKSAEAAKTTAELIEGSSKSVKKGGDIADNTAKTFAEITESTASLKKNLDAILSSTEEQRIAFEGMMDGVSQISSVVQSTGATASESAAAAEELSSQAHLMKQLINGYNIRKK